MKVTETNKMKGKMSIVFARSITSNEHMVRPPRDMYTRKNVSEMNKMNQEQCHIPNPWTM